MGSAILLFPASPAKMKAMSPQPASPDNNNHSSLWKLFRTSTFRLAALYLVVFIFSAGAILGHIYWNTAGLLERQTDDTIIAEVQGLADQYRIRGLTGVLDTIHRRSREARKRVGEATGAGVERA